VNDVLKSAEFGLVAACCRPRVIADFDAVVRTAAAKPFDADVLLATARAHRVEGFVEDGLRHADVVLPAAAQAVLADRAARSRQQMLRNAGEEVRVSRQFRAAGIEPIFVKGATLAILAHGSLALKTSWDIDMLVAPAEVGKARQLLFDVGYRLDLPGLDDPRMIDRYFEQNKETTWVNTARGTLIELHSALVDAPELLPGVGLELAVQSVEVGRNAPVTTLALPELYAYLCVHGTGHRWERLKWLTDVATLVQSSGETVDIFHAAANRFGAGRSSAVAMILSADMFGLPLPQTLRQNGTVAALVASSFSAMQTTETVDPDSFGAVRREISRLRAQRQQVPWLCPRLSVLRMQLSRATKPDRLAVPLWLLPLHTLIWLPLWMVRRSARKRQAAGGNTASKP
jgi:hypothetical protein